MTAPIPVRLSRSSPSESFRTHSTSIGPEERISRIALASAGSFSMRSTHSCLWREFMVLKPLLESRKTRHISQSFIADTHTERLQDRTATTCRFEENYSLSWQHNGAKPDLDLD